MSLSTHIIDDVLLRLVLLRVLAVVDGADDVHLVVLEGDVALVHVDDVVRVVDAETGRKKDKVRWDGEGFVGTE